MKILIFLIIMMALTGCSTTVRTNGDPSREIETPFITAEIKF